MKSYQKKLFGLAAAVVLAGCAGFTGNHKQEDTKIKWRTFGPGVGGANFAIAFHCKNPDIMLAVTDMGGLYRTEDGAKTWKMVGSHENGNAQPGYKGAQRAVFDPVKTNIAWVVSDNGAYKSYDTGKTWKRMTSEISGNPLAWKCLALDPSDTDIVYIAQGSVPNGPKAWSFGQIYRSVDGGKNWKELTRPGGPLKKDTLKTRNYYNIAIDPGSGFIKGEGHQRLFAFGNSGFWVSENGGKSWENPSNLPSPEVNDLIILSKNGKSYIFAAFKPVPENGAWTGGVYRSDDGGKTWIPKNSGQEKRLSMIAGGRGLSPLTLSASPLFPDVIYCGSRMDGVYKSCDFGETWSKVTFPGGEWVKVKDIDGKDVHLKLSRKGGNFSPSLKPGIWQVYDIDVFYGNPERVAFSEMFTVFISKDGGKNWSDALCEYGEAFDEGRFGDRPPMVYTHKTRTKGASMIVAKDLAVNPFDPSNIAICYSDIGLQITRDDGKWWEWATKGLYVQGRGHGQARSYVFDPAVKGRAYLTSGSQGRIYRTDNAGRSFEYIGIEQLIAEAQKIEGNRGKADAFSIWKVVIDPKSPPEKRTLYAATFFGVYKSVDGGRTWRDSSYGLDAEEIRYLLINPKDTNILYAATGRSRRERKDMRLGLFRTKDGGLNWTRIGSDKIGDIVSISISQSAPDTIYVIAAEPGKSANIWNETKLWRTGDGGDTWKLLDERRGSCVAVHPRNPDCLYYGIWARDLNTEKVQFLRSTDGGKTWEDIGSDMPLMSLTGIHFDPTDPHRFFALDLYTTYEIYDPVKF